jgi:hypothetical protein
VTRLSPNGRLSDRHRVHDTFEQIEGAHASFSSTPIDDREVSGFTVPLSTH